MKAQNIAIPADPAIPVSESALEEPSPDPEADTYNPLSIDADNEEIMCKTEPECVNQDQFLASSQTNTLPEKPTL